MPVSAIGVLDCRSLNEESDMSQAEIAVNAKLFAWPSKLGPIFEEHLVLIRTAQLQMADAAQWDALTEEQRREISERHAENEREVTHSLLL